ncbi:MAG: class I SAM-dependent methyltransferase [Candidatus Nealsonbacteria bacterium]|nr:class I SAM-dependent methyltransferase [Candidatus Nealsonbacteria bacterium]
MQEKLDIVAGLFKDYLRGEVLDIGCGEGYLRKFVEGKYTGLDKDGNPDIKADIRNGLNLKDMSFDTVLALDVLEHTDDIHRVFDNLCRISRQWIIISLPNIYEWRFRAYFMFGKELDDLYRFSETPPIDRHRWIMSFNQAKNFVRKMSEKNNFEIAKEMSCFYRYNKILPRVITSIGSSLGPRFHNIFANSYFALLKRR